MTRLIAPLVALFLAAPGLTQDIRVSDGDTFAMNGQVIHLWGVDARELDQTCLDLLQVGDGTYIDAEAVTSGPAWHWRYRCRPPRAWRDS